MAPPRPRPGPGLAQGGAGPARSGRQALFPLVGAAARARKRTGAEAADAEAPRPARVAAAASSGLRSAGAGPGSHAPHAPGPAGRLPAGLGGAAAGLPEHPGERQCGRPLAPSHVSLAGGHVGPRYVWPRGAGVRSWGPWLVPEGGEARGPGLPPGPSSRPHVSVGRRRTSPARPPTPRRTPPRPWDRGPPARASREGLGKRPRPQPRSFTEEWPLESELAGPRVGSVTQQTCGGRRPTGAASSAVPPLRQRLRTECTGCTRRRSGRARRWWLEKPRPGWTRGCCREVGAPGPSGTSGLAGIAVPLSAVGSRRSSWLALAVGRSAVLWGVRGGRRRGGAGCGQRWNMLGPEGAWWQEKQYSDRVELRKAVFLIRTLPLLD